MEKYGLKKLKRYSDSVSNWCKASPGRQIILFTCPAIILLTVISMGIVLEGSQQYALLTQSFLHGKLYFLQSIGGAGQDPVLWNNHVYWSEGPFPSIVLLPFSAIFDLFGHLFYQGYLNWLFIVGVMYFVYKIARKLKYNTEDSLLMACAFTLGSAFIGVASVSASWFFAQVLNTFLLFWALYEFYYHKRYWWIGILCACVLMTRATSIPIVLFFALEIWQGRGNHKQKLFQYVQLGAPLLVAIVLLGTYNYLRFQSPFNGGYMMQLLYPSATETESLGLFSLIHVPTNLYGLLLRGPMPVLRDTSSWTLKFPFIANNVYGMSIFLTSPYFLYLLRQRWSLYSATSQRLLIASAVSALLVLSYFGDGIVQFGFRYSLDFLPTLFVVFMIVYRKTHVRTTTGMKLLLIGGGIFNFYILWPMII
jgi:hypothetical protein